MKAALNMIGPPVGDPAPPVLPLQPEFIPTLAAILSDLGYKVKAYSPLPRGPAAQCFRSENLRRESGT